MAIVGTFPTTLQNGTQEDATQVMQLFSFIQSQINSNACPATSGTSVLKGNGSGGTTAATPNTDFAAANAVQNQIGVWCGTAGGTANAITVAPSPAVASLAAGMCFKFVAAATNTGATTLTVGTASATSVLYRGSALNPGMVVSGQEYEVDFDGTQFNLKNPSALNSNGTLLNIQTFTSNGTYTPSAGVNSALVIAVGGGGSAGSAGIVNVAGNAACSSGGQAGGLAIGIFTSTQIGASKAVTIGAGGIAPASAANPGNPGGDTSLGSLITAKGGAGGASSLLAASGYLDGGYASTAGTGGFLNVVGQAGEFAFWPTSSWGFGGAGGSSIYGAGGRKVADLTASSAVAGKNGSGYGAGGGGAVALGPNGGPVSGGNGSSGILIVYEYS